MGRDMSHASSSIGIGGRDGEETARGRRIRAVYGGVRASVNVRWTLPVAAWPRALPSAASLP
jgi:hypothetical protein